MLDGRCLFRPASGQLNESGPFAPGDSSPEIPPIQTLVNPMESCGLRMLCHDVQDLVRGLLRCTGGPEAANMNMPAMPASDLLCLVSRQNL